MNAQDYLEGVRMIKIDIERTISRIFRTESQLEAHGIIFDGTIVKRDIDQRLSAAVIDLLEYRETLLGVQTCYIKQETEADFIVSKIDNPNHRRVLGLRYMDGMTYREIAKRINYTPEGARKLCIRAVEGLDKILVPLLQVYSELSKVAK